MAADPSTGFNPVVEMIFSKKEVPVSHRHCTLTVNTAPALFPLLTALEKPLLGSADRALHSLLDYIPCLLCSPPVWAH